MDAGAFKDGKVIEASMKLVNIYVDCTERGTHQDLKQQYRVGGYPTIKFLSPDGGEVDEMRSREPADVASQFERIAATNTRK